MQPLETVAGYPALPVHHPDQPASIPQTLLEASPVTKLLIPAATERALLYNNNRESFVEFHPRFSPETGNQILVAKSQVMQTASTTGLYKQLNDGNFQHTYSLTKSYREKRNIRFSL
jgi:hypothetical protein